MANSNRIKSLREIYHLSQAQLAEKVSVTDKAVSSWENGTREPDSSTMKLLREAFGGLSTDYLMGEAPTSAGDQAAEALFEEERRKLAQTEECEKLVEKCKEFIRNLGKDPVGYSDVMPYADDDGNIILEGFDQEGRLSYEKLVAMRRADVLLNLMPEKISLDDALMMDYEPKMLDVAIMNLQKEYQPKCLSDQGEKIKRYDPNSVYVQTLNDTLRLVSKKMTTSNDRYWLFIKRLIEAGAFYTMWDGVAEEMGEPEHNVKDEIKTALVYHMATSYVGE